MAMKRFQVFLTLLFIADQVIIWACWSLGYWTRFKLVNFPVAEFIPPFAAYFQISWVVVILGVVSFSYGKMYHRKRIFHHGSEAGAIFKSMGLLYLGLIASSFFYRDHSFSRVQSVYFIAEAYLSISLFRALVRVALSYLRKKGYNVRRVLVLGKGKTARLLAEKLANNRSLGLIPVGYLAPQPDSELGLEYLGDYSQLHLTLESRFVDQVYIALDAANQEEMAQLNSQLATETVDLNIVPDIFHSLAINPEFLDFDGMPVLALRQNPVEGWAQVQKRSFDLFVGLCSVLVMAPFWVLLPLLIKLSSPGPVFYRQTRMGLDGRPFGMLKFRSMSTDAETKSGAVWAVKNDPRVTKIGGFLRKTSLDEIPQLFNVLKGDMSIVGPRPERPELITDFKEQIPNYMLRHKIKAGLTGWAQISGFRGNTSLEKRLEYDIYYLTHWSIWFDFKIFLLSLFKGFIDPNAY